MLSLFQSTKPHLSIRRPSPTTAEFIVSSHPPPNLPLRILFAVLLAARVVLALALLFALYLNIFPIEDTEYTPPSSISRPTSLPTSALSYHHHRHYHQHQPGLDPPSVIDHLHTVLRTIAVSTSPTRYLTSLAPTLSTLVVAGCTGAAVWLATLEAHTTETLLVLRGLGVQVQSRFIPTSKILDVLINEAFLGFEVRYYLAVVVEGEEDVVVVFPKLLPGRDVVEAVWKGVRGCLWEGDLVRRAGTDDR